MLNSSASETIAKRPASALQQKHETYRLSARVWLEQNLPRSWRPENPDYVAPGFEERLEFERRLYAEAGLAGWTWPREYGGQGLTMFEHLIGNEEIGRFSPPESLNGIGK